MGNEVVTTFGAKDDKLQSTVKKVAGALAGLYALKKVGQFAAKVTKDFAKFEKGMA